MKSMTGFGRSSSSPQNKAKDARGKAKANPRESQSAEADIDVSIRAVNGRFLETRIHLPREYAEYEGDLKTVLGEKFARGTVDVYINRSRGDRNAAVQVNTELAKAWLDGFRQLGRMLKKPQEPTLEMLTKVPELLRLETSEEVSEAELKRLKETLRAAAASCDGERQREGARLGKELASLCTRLDELIDQAEKFRTHANDELEQKLRGRLAEMMGKRGFEGVVDDQRIAHEIAIYLDRADISEELTRLREHLAAYRQLLVKADPQGKKLDFYAQELLREVNTIGSKSHVSKLTNLVVEAKTVVEKIREQVQNIE